MGKKGKKKGGKKKKNEEPEPSWKEVQLTYWYVENIQRNMY